MEQKTVFISYRRDKSRHLARSIYMDLKMHGWDVFLDLESINAGDFDRIILNQIAARAHFILLLSPGSLERCANPGDWVRREIEEAVRLKRNIVPVIEQGTDFNQEIGYLPVNLQNIISKKNSLSLPHDYFDAGMNKLRDRFLQTPEYVSVQETPAKDRSEIQKRITTMDIENQPHSSVNSKSTVFEWIDIPTGYVKLITDDYDKNHSYLKSDTLIEVPAFSIAKYPVTNAQFREFIKANGYSQPQWWTKIGWQACQEGWKNGNNEKKLLSEPWNEPRYWDNSQWNGADQPVVGVSWYEAIAFCLWLSDITGEKVMLPTEAQWQYAAQGNDGRLYPWGNEWDENCCNHSASFYDSNMTTPVTQYEEKGSSPFGVIDMAGNVWEWCLTDYINGANNFNNKNDRCVLRGGAWNVKDVLYFQVTLRNHWVPYTRGIDGGFRCIRSYKS